VTITASHPAIVGHCSRSAEWRLVDVKKLGSTRQRYAGREVRCSRGRAVAAFEWVGQARSAECGMRSEREEGRDYERAIG
jgi:hypothetical protein